MQPQEQLDPSIVALTKAIGHQESGGDYKKIGDNGHSMGAYQWNNPTPLAKGQVPKNFGLYASEVGADANDFSPENQDRVAYKTVEKWGKQGLTPAQIASKWNSGSPDKYKTAKPGYNAEQGVHYDVKSYVDNVAKYYQEYQGGNSGNQNVSQGTQTDLTKDTIVGADATQPSQGNSDLKANDNPILDYAPGAKLAQGAGYGLAAATGSQEGLINANSRGMDIQGQLLAQLQRDKAKGKDTSKLEKALKDLNIDLTDEASQISDVGTGGISNNQVLGSAAELATLPAAAYATTALSGGGLMGTSRGLVSGFGGEGFLGSSKAAPKILSNPVVKGILEGAIGKGETIADLSRQEAINTLGNALKEMSVSESGGKTEQIILKALQQLNPTLVEKQNLVKTLLKGGYNIGKNLLLTQLLGEKIGGFIHQYTK